MLRRHLCMNKLLQILTLAVLVLTSQLSPAQSDHRWDSNRLGWDAQTATAGARARVIITKPKVKLHLAKTQRPVIQLSANDDDTDYYDELPEFQVGYRRPELVDQTAEVHDDLSDNIKIRLVLARKRALEAYDRKWA